MLDITVKLDIAHRLGLLGDVLVFLLLFFGSTALATLPRVVLIALATSEDAFNGKFNEWTNGINDHSHHQLISDVAIPIIGKVIVGTVEEFAQKRHILKSFSVGHLQDPSSVKEGGQEHIG